MAFERVTHLPGGGRVRDVPQPHCAVVAGAGYPRLVERVEELAGRGLSSRQIAEALNADGLRPPKRTDRFGPGQILALTHRLGVRVRHPRGTRTAVTGLGPGRYSVSGLAAALEMPTVTVYTWIHRGWITAEHDPDGGFWVVTADDAEIRRLRDRRDRPRRDSSRARWAQPPAEQAGPPEEGTRT